MPFMLQFIQSESPSILRVHAVDETTTSCRHSDQTKFCNSSRDAATFPHTVAKMLRKQTDVSSPVIAAHPGFEHVLEVIAVRKSRSERTCFPCH